MSISPAAKLASQAEKLLNLAGDSQDYTRSKASKYFDRIVRLLEEAQLVPDAVTRQQTIGLARIAGSLQAEFQF
jgi:hypothetical protein